MVDESDNLLRKVQIPLKNFEEINVRGLSRFTCSSIYPSESE